MDVRYDVRCGCGGGVWADDVGVNEFLPKDVGKVHRVS